ncbi:hypothetical protein [Wenzhouxiangella sediminis]|uniref:Uncharacterized protein n=1 Tax=Wenzhouxiangella sediminis TaxID=1792836 RepID=A0A3E1KB57_9GAMM|nr:hypothetical protein [Wenzhouxiangella sediminis]RFF31743.1 hypothetical protein DZC52_03600 [Wenzhouxiangella sediminis]
MKRLLLLVVIGLILLAVGVNWYYTRQVRDQLDQMANAVSMFGTLSYDSVRLSPGGAVNINDLSFQLHQGRGGVDVGRISLQTANLLALFTLEGKLESGRLPESLGVSVKDVRFPLDGALASMSRQMPGGTSPTFASGVPFDAAGCDGRTQFSANDLMHMDYFDIRADVEVHYQLIDDGNRLRFYASARTYDASAIHLDATIDLAAGSLSTLDLARSMENARLSSFSLEYEDLGYYERMLAFCAEEMDMSRSEYLAHHLEAWKQAWARFNAEAGPDLVAAYESFLNDPKQISVRSDAETSVSFDGIENYTMSGLLERMNVRLVVNYGDPQPLDIKAPESPRQRIASAPTPASDPIPASAEAPTDTQDTAAASKPDDATTPARAESADTGTTEEATAEPASRWVRVEPAELDAYRNDRVRIRMRSGDSYAGRLERVDADNVHIRVEGVGGFYIRPLALEEIREVEVYGGF